MEIRERVEQDILFLRPVAEHVDAAMAIELKALLTARIAEGARTVALNLEDVQFMDSTGLGVLITTLRLLECRGELVLCGVRESVLGLLRVTSLVRILTIYDDEQEVIADCAGRVI